MIICICGPTGVGITKLSIKLAQKYKAIVINADAMQVYKGLDIGTAKITENEKENIPHYLFDIKDVTQNYTVYDYQQDLRALLKKYAQKNIIIVGGTGLYIKAGLYDYRFYPQKENLNFTKLTNEELYKLCLKKDPNMNIHLNNRRRLENFLKRDQEEFNKDKLLYPAIFIGLTTSRENLYDKINTRVEEMFRQGLLEEAKYFYAQKIYSKALLTGIGYKELYLYFDHKISLEEAKELIKKNSRHYAKRQYTWFNNQMNLKWFDVNFANFEQTIKEVEEYINSKCR